MILRLIEETLLNCDLKGIKRLTGDHLQSRPLKPSKNNMDGPVYEVKIVDIHPIANW